MKKGRMSKKKRELVKKIMEENSTQRRVDDIVKKTKEAMELYKKECFQADVDKMVSEELAKK